MPWTLLVLAVAHTLGPALPRPLPTPVGTAGCPPSISPVRPPLQPYRAGAATVFATPGTVAGHRCPIPLAAPTPRP